MYKMYDIKCGHMGCINGKYQEFPTDDEYYEYYEEERKERERGKGNERTVRTNN